MEEEPRPKVHEEGKWESVQGRAWASEGRK